MKANGANFKEESSASISDRFGPSSSHYFHVETPDGPRTIRVSDHDYLSPDGGLDLRLGGDARLAQAKILRMLGRPLPQDLADYMRPFDEKKANDAATIQAQSANTNKLIDQNITKDKIYRQLLKENGIEENAFTLNDGNLRNKFKKEIKKRLIAGGN